METCTLHRRVNLSTLHFLAYSLEEVNVFFKDKCEINILTYFDLTWALIFWAYAWREITFCSFFEWNQHPCCQTLTWNQHFNLFWPEIDIFELIRCRKLTFLLFSIYNEPPFRQGLMWNQHSNHFDLKLSFLSLRAAWN